MEADNKDVLNTLIKNLNILPDTAVNQIAKYVSSLKEEYVDIQIIDSSILCPLEKERFIGIWADRADMADSAERIRRLRTA